MAEGVILPRKPAAKALILSGVRTSSICFPFAALWVALLCATQPTWAQTQSSPEMVNVDLSAGTHPFPHFWERMFGSGRAILSLRESYRHDLRDVKRITGLEYVRFHAIFNDEVGIYSEDAHGAPIYNFSYANQIYDGLVQNGVHPFVELSFMPQKLAAAQIMHSFWYKPIISPPKDWAKWGDLISHFARHLVDRYGIDEVSQWYFEVWNEPNLDFWAGDPKEQTYYQLYDAAAKALKAMSPRLRVGGPGTAQAAWVDRFIQHVTENKIPADFVSTHVYGNDSAENVLGINESVPRTQMVCRAARKVHDQVAASPQPSLPIIWSEYNASYKNEPDVTDSTFMGPWLADTIRQCDGLVQMMSYWTFSDVFEEQGVVKEPFYGGFGLLAERGLPKPAFNAFKLLHYLGSERIPVDSNSAIVTRRIDGSLVIALWNLDLPEERGQTKQVALSITGLTGRHHAVISRVDATHGSLLNAYEAMGRPQSPTLAEIERLREAAELGSPETQDVEGGQLIIALPPQGLAVIEIQ
ncbi:MAG: glycosyl hydrolase family 39 [Acidobacteria bacterium]|nr:MAG: glycosyl hydrolase family 39 [Acidobacteriota bacterium]